MEVAIIHKSKTKTTLYNGLVPLVSFTLGECFIFTEKRNSESGGQDRPLAYSSKKIAEVLLSHFHPYYIFYVIVALQSKYFIQNFPIKLLKYLRITKV